MADKQTAVSYSIVNHVYGSREASGSVHCPSVTVLWEYFPHKIYSAMSNNAHLRSMRKSGEISRNKTQYHRLSNPYGVCIAFHAFWQYLILSLLLFHPTIGTKKYCDCCNEKSVISDFPYIFWKFEQFDHYMMQRQVQFFCISSRGVKPQVMTDKYKIAICVKLRKNSTANAKAGFLRNVSTSFPPHL